MVRAAGLGERLGITPSGTADRIAAMLTPLGLPVEIACTAEEYAAALGLGEIHLHVERDNHGARRLYQRRGFGVLAEQGARLLLGKKL
mgnify:CR=1 FL=1